MWFTKETDGFRAWFSVQDKNGAIRTGIPSGQFVATIIDPTDTVSLVPTVTESAVKAGLYTFLVTSTFLGTNGNGGYAVVVEVNALAAPKVAAVFSQVLEVYDQDFDSISGAVWEETRSAHLTAGTMGAGLVFLSYAGVIHIDTKNGAAGTTIGIHGTVHTPVDNLADAVTIAAATGIRRYHLTGNITLVSAHDDWVIEGDAAEAAVNIGSQDVADSLFRNCQLSGTIGTGPISADNCELDGIGNFTGTALDCGLVSDITLGAGISSFVGCSSQVPGLSTPNIDLDDVASLNMRAYSGGIEIRNLSDPGQNVTLEFIAGQAVLPASCSGGTITLRGIGNLTDNSTGTTVEKNAFLNIDAIWDEIQDGTITARTVMERINAMARGKMTLTGATTKPAQDAVYFDESGSPLYTNRNTGNERNPL